MKTRKIASLVTASLITISNAAHADLEIIPNSEPSLGNDNLEEHGVVGQVVETKTQKVEVQFTEMPLAIVVDALKPKDWNAVYLNSTDNQSVSWGGNTDNWYDAIKFVGVANGLNIEIDFDKKTLNVSKAVEVTKSKAANTATSDSSSQFQPNNGNPVIPCVEQEQESTVAQSKADEVLECKDENCTDKVVNIEKLVFDTTWTSEPTAVDTKVKDESLSNKDIAKRHSDTDKTVSVNDNTISKLENEESNFDLELEKKHKDMELQFKSDYNKSYILHGNGTFEDFINGGGLIETAQADNNQSYTYVYKQGTLFTSIEKWAELNGYVVKNDILDIVNKDYPNISTVYLKGDFFEVTSALLNKYKNAEYPVNHRFYKKGKVLHIFSGKYNTNTRGVL